MNVVICLAGGVASGKTTLAQALAARLGTLCAVRSFGDVVRHRAQREGLPLDRQTLQTVGLTLVHSGWTAFVDELLVGLPSDTAILIIDGIRHLEAIDELRTRWPGVPVRLILLDADEKVIATRLSQRGETATVRDHETESHFEELADQANLHLYAGADLGANIERVIAFLDVDTW